MLVEAQPYLTSGCYDDRGDDRGMRLGFLEAISVLLRLGRLAGIAGVGAVGLGWAGCAGDAFTLQATAGSSTSTSGSSSMGTSSAGSSSPASGASGSSATVGPVDASASFCSAYAGDLFCEAFDDGAPGQLLEQPQDAAAVGTYSTDPDASVPPSKQSLEVTTPQVNMPGASARTLAGKSFTTMGTDLVLDAEFNVGKNCLSDGVAIAIVTASSDAAPGSQYSIVLTVGASAWGFVEILDAPDAGVTSYAHSATPGLLADQWTNVKLTVHLLKKTVDLTVGSSPEFMGEVLHEAPLFPVAGTGSINASFAVGAAVTDVDAEALACALEVDNVVFNATTTAP